MRNLNKRSKMERKSGPKRGTLKKQKPLLTNSFRSRVGFFPTCQSPEPTTDVAKVCFSPLPYLPQAFSPRSLVGGFGGSCVPHMPDTSAAAAGLAIAAAARGASLVTE